MEDLLIEIGTEELPPSVIEPSLDFIKTELSKILAVDEINAYATPRRLVFYVESFRDEVITKEEVVFGPPWKVAFDEDGKPTKALEGFLRKHGAKVEDVFKAKKGKGEYVALRIVHQEKSRLEALKERFEEILLSVPLPKRMRWTSSRRLSFSRPVRWLLALHGSRVVELSFGELKAGRKTRAHRLLSEGWLEIPDTNSYFEVLKDNHVILSPEERKSMILEQLRKSANEVGAQIEAPEGLLEEVLYLVEYPFPVVGSFDEKFLELPSKVIITVSAHHQRFFCLSKEGRLVNRFIGISNNRPKTDAIRKGYERVLKARLEDALFFYREDLKKRLEELVPRLSEVMVHPRVGTMLEKTDRLVKLTHTLCTKLACNEDTKEKVRRASYLSKADLLTEMVKELDELQGYMGYVYALKQGEDREVALALYEQYKPRGLEDELPSTVVGALLSLADKIDDLISFFKAGEIPKGSSDPYGLRRAAFGIFRLLEAYLWDIDIRDFRELYGDTEKTYKELESFLAQRLESYLSHLGYDVVRAVLSVENPLRPFSVMEKAKELSKIKDSSEFVDIYEAYRRVAKILPRDWESAEVDEKLLKEKEELVLWESIKYMEGRDFKLSELAGLRRYIDALFDNVLIMDRDERVRSNRLSLLMRLKKLFHRYADFSKVVIREV